MTKAEKLRHIEAFLAHARRGTLAWHSEVLPAGLALTSVMYANTPKPTEYYGTIGLHSGNQESKGKYVGILASDEYFPGECICMPDAVIVELFAIGQASLN